MTRHLRTGLGILELAIAASAGYGGIGLMYNGMGMPSDWLAGTPFHSWFLPGLALLLGIGGSQLLAAYALLRGWPAARLVAIGAGAVLIVWIVVQVLVLQRFHVMQPTILLLGAVVAALAWQLPHGRQPEGRPQ